MNEKSSSPRTISSFSIFLVAGTVIVILLLATLAKQPTPESRLQTQTARVIAQSPTSCSMKSSGDANCDGRVTLADFEIWRREFTGQVMSLDADFNADSRVSLADFEVWRRMFTQGIPQISSSPTPPISAYTPFGMAFFNPSPEGYVCEYPVVAMLGRQLKSPSGTFNPAILQEAEACGTKIVIFLSSNTNNIVADAGGLDLTKYRNEIAFFAGKIDEYVNRGVIISHMNIDEPHDCHDWKGVCPLASVVDEAGKISKEYWPNLPTSVTMLPGYITSTANVNYTWQHTDILNLQYAYHKGDLNMFVSKGIDIINQGKLSDIAWALQVASGGCPTYGTCNMTPAQVIEVSTAMCTAHAGKWNVFTYYNPSILTPEMLTAIETVKSVCGG